jgi:quinoprotein glucose dehydrogenase
VDGPFVHYAAPYTQFVSQGSRLPTIAPPWFQMTAYDLNAGRILWQVPYGVVSSLAAQGRTNTGVLQQQRGGPIVTAGGLIFAATNDKKMRAYDQDTGKVVWEAKLPAAAEGVPAIYEVGGRQFVAICAAAGNGPDSGPGPRQGPTSPGAYIAFALPKR